VDAKGKNGDVKIIYTIIKRKELQEVVRIIESAIQKPFIQLKMPERSIRVFSGQVRQTMMGQGFLICFGFTGCPDLTKKPGRMLLVPGW